MRRVLLLFTLLIITSDVLACDSLNYYVNSRYNILMGKPYKLTNNMIGIGGGISINNNNLLSMDIGYFNSNSQLAGFSKQDEINFNYICLGYQYRFLKDRRFNIKSGLTAGFAFNNQSSSVQIENYMLIPYHGYDYQNDHYYNKTLYFGTLELLASYRFRQVELDFGINALTQRVQGYTDYLNGVIVQQKWGVESFGFICNVSYFFK